MGGDFDLVFSGNEYKGRHERLRGLGRYAFTGNCLVKVDGRLAHSYEMIPRAQCITQKGLWQTLKRFSLDLAFTSHDVMLFTAS